MRFVLALLLVLPVSAQIPLTEPFELPGVTYASNVPAPEDVIGHVIGSRHTRPDQIVEYFEAVDAASDRVSVREYGRTWEGRPLIYAVVASPANVARIDEIVEQNRQLSDAPESVSDAMLGEMPAVVHLHYAVHGNEASGAEAALLVLYHLAAGQGAPVEDVLSNTVVIIDPVINPDGLDRFADWVNRNRGGVPTADPQDREHNEAWPNGRTNHYLFDLNRDWLLVQHPESKGRVELFHTFRPQVLIDVHEMGGNSTFFFQPGVPSRNNPNTPARTFDLTRELATYHAAALDRIGSLYYTEESFDDFYYGKGSTYPDVNGAVGVLFEQGSSRGLERETTQGRLTYGFGVMNQLAASLGTLAGAVNMRERLLRHQRDFYAEADRVAQAMTAQAYVVGTGSSGHSRWRALGEMLKRHRIEVHALAEPVTQNGQRFEPGSAFVVPVRQKQARLVKAVFERVRTFQDSLFYDVSTWTMPLAFNLPYAEVRSAGTIVGDEIDRFEPMGQMMAGEGTPYAYLIEWGGYYAPRTLGRLLRAGVEVRTAVKPFRARVGDATLAFGRGTLIVPTRQRNADATVTPEDVAAIVRQAVDEDDARAFATDGGLTPAGGDLGGPSARILRAPHIAILSGEGTSVYGVGEVWHMLTERMAMPISLIDIDRVDRLDLSRYTVIVAPNGSYWAMSPGGASALKDWVQQGGRLVALENAARWAVNQGMTDATLKDGVEDTLSYSYEERPLARGAQFIGGTILNVELDETHPLAFGYGASVPVFRRNTLAFGDSVESSTVVGTYAASPVLSGYASGEQEQRLASTPALVAEPNGAGEVILMPDNPSFRAFWYGTDGLLMNAILMPF